MSVLFVSYSLISFNFYLFYFPGTAAEHRLGTSGLLLNRAVQLRKRLHHFYRYLVGIGLKEYADSYERTYAEESVRLGYSIVSMVNRTFRGNALLLS